MWSLAFVGLLPLESCGHHVHSHTGELIDWLAHLCEPRWFGGRGSLWVLAVLDRRVELPRNPPDYPRNADLRLR